MFAHAEQSFKNLYLRRGNIHQILRYMSEQQTNKEISSKEISPKEISPKEISLNNSNSKGQKIENENNFSSHLTFFKAPERKCTKQQAEAKPLVVLFQWLYAKPQHIVKYTKLYHDIGLDVLTVRGKLSHFLWPPVSAKLSQEICTYLKENRPANEKMFVHAFSIGTYNYSTVMKAAAENPIDCVYFRDRVVGQIFDSIVLGTYENMSQGITDVLPANEAFRKLVITTLNVYYEVTHKKTKQTYDELVQHFKEDPIMVPTLFFCSHNDPMCDPAALDTMITKWRVKGPKYDVTNVSWPKSVHVAHLSEHNREYKAAWASFMKKLKLLHNCDQFSDKEAQTPAQP